MNDYRNTLTDVFSAPFSHLGPSALMSAPAMSSCMLWAVPQHREVGIEAAVGLRL